MHDHVGQLDIFISQGWRVRTEGFEITGYGRGHAHTSISLNSIGTQHPFHEQVFQVLPFHGQLAGTIKRDRVAGISLGQMGDFVIHHLASGFIRDSDKVLIVKGAFGLADIFQITVARFLPLGPDILTHIGVPFHPIDINRLGGG